MDTIPIIDRREGERRKDWHTPDDCAKLLGVQLEIAGITQRLDKGDTRMAGIERTIAEGAKVSAEERSLIKQMLYDNHQHVLKEMADSAEKMKKPLEIIESAEGFFNGVVATGKWTRRIIMWVLPAATAVLSFFYAVQQSGIL